MSKKDDSDLGPGVWRTVGGRRIFIKEGNDLATAMRESGKFEGIIKETPSRKYNDDVSFICKIRGVAEIEKEYGKLKNYDVVLTDERKKHILQRRGEKDYEIIMKNMDDTLKKYDYITDNKEQNSITFVKHISNSQNISIHLKLSVKKESEANSNITAFIMNDKAAKRYINSRKILVKKK